MAKSSSCTESQLPTVQRGSLCDLRYLQTPFVGATYYIYVGVTYYIYVGVTYYICLCPLPGLSCFLGHQSMYQSW